MKRKQFHALQAITCLAYFSIITPSQAVDTLPKKEATAKPKTKTKAAPSLRFAGIFANNMVIQRNTNAPIWGYSAPKSKVVVKVSWSKETATTTADDKGRWKVSIPTPEAGGPHTVELMSGNKTAKIKNVLSGEVWLCGGQSNMQWKMRGFGPKEYKEATDNANFPNIRFCDVPQLIGLKGQDDTKTRWTVCNPKSVTSFSAVAYFFGSQLHQELNVPIGLISNNWGGSEIEGWISPEVLGKELPNYKNLTKKYPDWMKKYGVTIPRFVKTEKGLNQSSPSVLYNAMIRPIIPFSFRGVIWYQGESNVERPAEYAKLFPAMIRDWRQRWGMGDFPFYYVQIAPFHYNYAKLPSSLLREAQLVGLSEPNTAMAVTMDVGNVDNIHPRGKDIVGKRLALIALAREYGKKDLVYSGPMYRDYKVEGGKIRLDFDSIGTGLATLDDGDLTHFTIAGEDQKFVPAKAVIDGTSVIVSSEKVSNPTAVRFGWGDADLTNFANKEGLPASSFRTDTWTINPQKKPKRKTPAKK